MAEPGQVLERQAEAEYRRTDYPAALRLYEQAFTAYRDAGDVRAAARTARIIGWLQGNVNGAWAVSNGWVSRARSLLTEAGAGDDSAEHGRA